MSIGKSQANALADGFLDSLGDGKEGLRPRETLSELFLIAGEMVESMQDNLNRSNSNASGKLSASIKVDDPIQNGNIVRADILMNFYGRFVNKGVKGTVSGKSTAGYKFKNAFPNQAMAKALLAGVSRAKASTKNTNAKKTTSINEKKNSTNAEAKAYGAAVNIKKFGIKPTGFLDQAIITTKSKVENRLGGALKIDVINALKAE